MRSSSLFPVLAVSFYRLIRSVHSQPNQLGLLAWAQIFLFRQTLQIVDSTGKYPPPRANCSPIDALRSVCSCGPYFLSCTSRYGLLLLLLYKLDESSKFAEILQLQADFALTGISGVPRFVPYGTGILEK